MKKKTNKCWTFNTKNKQTKTKAFLNAFAHSPPKLSLLSEVPLTYLVLTYYYYFTYYSVSRLVFDLIVSMPPRLFLNQQCYRRVAHCTAHVHPPLHLPIYRYTLEVLGGQYAQQIRLIRAASANEFS